MLDVIGAGFGRTGTLSLKLALEQLGHGPCYHMFEVYEYPDDADVWLAAARGEAVDWDDVLGDYRSTVDWPGCTFWRELLDWSPQAKVILSVRDAEGWYSSYAETVERVLRQPRPRLTRFADEVVARRSFGPYGWCLEERAAVAAYVRHNLAVMNGVPADRLLVYDIIDGWEPLCDFLEHDLPLGAFPIANDRDDFMRRHSYLNRST